MNNIEELKSAYRDVELTARNMRGKPEEYRVVTGFCPVNVVEMQAQKIQALIAKLEAAQLELIKPLPIGELVHRLEGQTYEKWFSESDVKDLRERAQKEEAELSAANEKLKGEQVPVSIDADIIRDANRYRFLRDEDSWGEDSDSWDVETRTGLISSENLMELRLDHFDAAIDARMAASDIPLLNPANAPQKPVVLSSSTVMSRAYVVQAIKAAGFTVEGE